jgi:ribonuclease P protein component
LTPGRPPRTLAALLFRRVRVPDLKPRYTTNETYVPAQHPQARTHARIPCTDGYQGRPPRAEAPSCEGSRQADTVIPTGRHPATHIHELERSSSYRFTTRNRLLDARAFARVFDKATRSGDALFTVLCRDNEQQPARLGLAIAKKHCKKATSRNRIKRIIRESFRQHSTGLAGLDIVVLNRPGSANASNPELFASLERHWRRCERSKASGKE